MTQHLEKVLLKKSKFAKLRLPTHCAPMSNPVKNSLESTGEEFEKPRVVEIGQTSWYQQVLRLYNKFLKNVKNEKDLIPLLKDKLRF